jgi:pilus assembly protein CpaB
MDRQKKVLIFVGAWISAGLLVWFLYAKTVAPQTEKQVRVVVATHDMPLGTLLRQSDVKLVNYAERYVPKGAVLDPKEAVGRVLLVPVNNNELVLLSKVSAPTNVEGMASTIEPGFRAVAVQINDATGVAGMIQPSARVDVLFTRPGTMAEAITSTILQNVKVLATGHQATTAQAAAEARTTRTPVVTLLLTPADAQKLELAKNQGKISLSLRNPLDGATAVETGPVTTEVLDPNVNARIALAKKGRVGGKSDLNDPRMWQELTGKKEEQKKEPEKPRAVVDVFHGDKHVQEIFK